jgi:hypothetical protein
MVEEYRQFRRQEKRIHRYHKRQNKNNLLEEIEHSRLQNESKNSTNGLIIWDRILCLDQGWANFFVGGPNEKSKMSGGPT